MNRQEHRDKIAELESRRTDHRWKVGGIMSAVIGMAAIFYLVFYEQPELKIILIILAVIGFFWAIREIKLSVKIFNEATKKVKLHYDALLGRKKLDEILPADSTKDEKKAEKRRPKIDNTFLERFSNVFINMLSGMLTALITTGALLLNQLKIFSFWINTLIIIGAITLSLGILAILIFVVFPSFKNK